MKAAYIEATGTPDAIRIGELPTPEPKAGEVRVRVSSASVNPIDTYIRAGIAKMELPFPFILGADFGGTVEALGAGATAFQVGDRVWGSNQGMLGRQGTFAEYACVNEAYSYPIPAGVSDEAVSAVALVGITAHLGLVLRARLQKGETVFVNGGTGGVGAMVVQIAKALGAKVIATVGTPAKGELAVSLGADHVINYKTENVAEAVKAATGGRGVDVWYETTPPTDFDATVNLMAANGRIVVMAGRAARPVLPNGPFYVKGLSLLGFAMFNTPLAVQREAAMDINRWLAEGSLKPVIGEVFPLAETAAAHRLQEANTLGKAGTLTGKIVLKIPG